MSWFFEVTRQLGTKLPRVWVETGTFRGDTTARQVAWFRHIFTIELDPTLAAAARERFKDEPTVEVHEGDSAEVLAWLCATSPHLQEPAVFYLDGHWSGGVTARGREEEDGCPLLREVAVLGRREYEDLIVVDDVRLFGKKVVSGSGGDWPPTEFDWRHVTEESLLAAYSRPAEVHYCQGIDRLVLVPSGVK